MISKYSLGKKDRLKSRKLVDELFKNGASLAVFPLKVIFAFFPFSAIDDAYLKVGVTASRRSFKRAVDRNRIKRLIRESYRLQKSDLHALLEKRGLKAHLFFIYIDKQLPAYPVMFDAMTKCLRLLEKRKSLNESPS
ncbi:MAG TPA: ribonuclease P protein component [Chitinophagaceae bacterium]|nr:ribonuclease P protein component [Chitinophagaceae bacterium]